MRSFTNPFLAVGKGSATPDLIPDSYVVMAAVAEAARGKGYAMEEEKGGMMDGDVDRLTVDETEQYDRQIRLWGLDAQKRLST